MYCSGMVSYKYNKNTEFINTFTTNYRYYPSQSNQQRQRIDLIWLRENKLIDMSRNHACPITYIDFIPECKYCVCTTCKYNIDANILKEYF